MTHKEAKKMGATRLADKVKLTKEQINNIGVSVLKSYAKKKKSGGYRYMDL